MVKSDKDARSLVVKRPFFSTATATKAETVAVTAAKFEGGLFVDQRRFSPPSGTRFLDKFVFSAASVHHTQHPLFFLFLKKLYTYV